jgi:hypothetical protein
MVSKWRVTLGFTRPTTTSGNSGSMISGRTEIIAHLGYPTR